MELLDLPGQLSARGMTPRDPAPAPPRVITHGRLEVGFAVRDGVTRLKHLYQHDPLRALFPRVPPGDIPVAALVTTSGGLVGGDRIEIDARVEAGARARIAPQAAEKIYRSLGEPVTVELDLAADAGAWLEYLPMETILFDGARLDRVCRLSLESNARAMAGEFLVFGRLARGEVMTHGTVRDAIEVRRDGRLLWADAFDPRGGLGALDHPAGLGGGRALATLVYAGVDAADHVEPVRALQEECRVPDGQAGATAIGTVLVARWIGRDVLAMRRAYATVWQALRARAAGLPPALPRHWHV